MDQNEYETDADKPDHMLSLYQFIRKFAKLLEKSFFHHLNLVKWIPIFTLEDTIAEGEDEFVFHKCD